MLMPRQPVPALRVPTVAHGNFDLAEDAPQAFSLVVFYRGLHCPICAKYLIELGTYAEEFAARGVATIAVSAGRIRSINPRHPFEHRIQT